MTARLRGLAATLTLLGLLIGLPTVLVALGPITPPATWHQALDGLLRPDDGTLAVNIIKILAWIAWAVLAGTVVVEALAWTRNIQPPRLPLLGRPQLIVRDLVAAAVLLFVATPAVGQPTPAAAQPVPVHVAGPAHKAPQATPHEHAEAKNGQQRTVEHVVRRGESLWTIAKKHLGDGARYPELARLNRHLVGDDPGFLKVGWTLRLPAPEKDEQTAPASGRATRYVVREGDTLSEIAQDRLGDAHAYPPIFDASRSITQPGGRHLNDPDQIDVGWTLTIPDTQGHKASKAPEQPKVPAGRSVPPVVRTPRPQPTVSTPSTSAPTAAEPAAPAKPSASAEPAESSPASMSPSLAGHIPTATTADAAPVTDDDEAVDAPPSWLVAGLTGAGSLLAAGLLVWLRRARGAQRRFRRPGRTIAPPPPEVTPVEKTLIAAGGPALPTLELIDQALRRLTPSAEGTMPRIAAVEVSDRLTLHLAVPADLPAPWQPAPDAAHWSIPADTQPGPLGPMRDPDSAAPYPQLAVLGSSDKGATWLLNLEELGTLTITGDTAHAADLARALAAEIAVNPWTRDVRIDCVGVAEHATPLNPMRARHHTTPDVIGHVLADAVQTVDRLTEAEAADISTARAVDAGYDLWEGRLLVLDATHSTDEQLKHLLRLVDDQPGRTGVAIIIVGGDPKLARHTLELTPAGRVHFDEVGLNLVAAGLTPDEAEGCAILINAADDLDDEPVPDDPEATDGWRSLTDQAGALLEQLTQPRDATKPDPTSLLEAPDNAYTAVAAATVEDLVALAPSVPSFVNDQVRAADPSLDADLELWFADTDTLPRLWLLGPLKGRTGSGGDPTALLKRKAHTLELAAYLATRPHGATTAQIADAFGITFDRVRKDMSVVRRWLGTNPRTGRLHLPDATTTQAAKTRGVGAYQLDDVLVDADLFRRLRARAQSRGSEGIADLRTALKLVMGTPFSDLRSHSGAWLADNDRLDQQLLCAIVDVAHIVTTDALHKGDLAGARAAAEAAHGAAPEEDTPRLDLAAVLTAEGRPAEADHLAREICNRSDIEGSTPTDLPQRTDRLIRQHDWINTKRRAAS